MKFMHMVARFINTSLDLLADHLFLSLQLFGIKIRVKHHIGQHFNAIDCVITQRSTVVASRFLIRERI